MAPLESALQNSVAIQERAKYMLHRPGVALDQRALADDAMMDPERLQAILGIASIIQGDIQKHQEWEGNLIKVLEGMVADITLDPRYDQPCHWQSNIYLHTMQAEWKAKVNILEQVIAQLKRGQSQ